MKKTPLLITCCTLLLLACLTPNLALAQADSMGTTPETLRGLKGVRVVVEPIGADAEKAGLDRQQIQQDIELKLRTAGVPVLVGEEAFRTPLDSYLRVNVLLVKGRFWTWAYSVTVQLSQTAKLSSGAQCFAVTWTKGEVGITTSGKIAKLRETTIKDLTDGFLNDFLSVNPR